MDLPNTVPVGLRSPDQRNKESLISCFRDRFKLNVMVWLVHFNASRISSSNSNVFQLLAKTRSPFFPENPVKWKMFRKIFQSSLWVPLAIFKDLLNFFWLIFVFLLLAYLVLFSCFCTVVRLAWLIFSLAIFHSYFLETLKQSQRKWNLRPSNSSSRVSRISHALIGAMHLIAVCHVVLALKARCHAVEVLLACSIPLFLIEFVTAWSWYGHFSKSLFSLNLWLVVYRLAVLYQHLSVNVSLQGNTTFWDWSQVFRDRTFWVPGLYRTLSQ